MSFNMDDLFSDAKRYVGIVGEKTGSAVEYSKKQVSRVQLRVQFREKLTELGRLCYDMHEQNIDRTGEMKKLIEEMEDIEATIKEAENAVGVAKVCPLCGTKNRASNAYCSKCGERLDR